MNNENYMMYEFKGRIMKELSRRLTKKVSINIFYKEDGDFIGIILSTPECKEDNNRLYRIEDPWSMITNSISIGPSIDRIVGSYKAYIVSRYFKDGRYEKDSDI